jgi:hypothetical protein
MNLLYDIHGFLIDSRWWLTLPLSVILLAIYGRVLMRAAFASGAPTTRPSTRSSQIPPIRRPTPKPAAPPAPGAPKPPAVPETGKQEMLPDALGAGVAGHQKAGAAKTVKIPTVPPRSTDGQMASDTGAALAPTIRSDKPKTTNGAAAEAAPAAPAKDADEEALQGLFGGEAPPTETNTGAIRRKASRLEELGFHHGIAFDQPQGAEAAKTPPISPAGAPRSSTAELTSILERIDKFLAEDTPAKPGEAKPAATAPVAAAVKPTEIVAAPAAPAPTPAEPPKPPATVPPAAALPPTLPPTEAAPAADKADPRKTQPLWARSDAQDEDLDKPQDNGKDGKTGEGQQRLF